MEKADFAAMNQRLFEASEEVFCESKKCSGR